MIYHREEISSLAHRAGYVLESAQEFIGLLVFVKPGIQVNVYTTKMTVGTCIQHPKKGKTQLFRRHVSMPVLARILANPREHGHGGYLRKAEKGAFGNANRL